jgi:hypothetical protein
MIRFIAIITVGTISSTLTSLFVHQKAVEAALTDGLIAGAAGAVGGAVVLWWLGQKAAYNNAKAAARAQSQA